MKEPCGTSRATGRPTQWCRAAVIVPPSPQRDAGQSLSQGAGDKILPSCRHGEQAILRTWSLQTFVPLPHPRALSLLPMLQPTPPGPADTNIPGSHSVLLSPGHSGLWSDELVEPCTSLREPGPSFPVLPCLCSLAVSAFPRKVGQI